jgi:dephospho-CoA kinase
VTDDLILNNLSKVSELYHRLILAVGHAGSGKTEVLRAIVDRQGYPLINVNLVLSRRLLELTERQRTLQLPRLMGEIVREVGSDTVLLDNLEVLFDVGLKQDPLRLLQNLSRNCTIIAAWNGSISAEHLIYAVPEHVEYRRYSAAGIVAVEVSKSQ